MARRRRSRAHIHRHEGVGARLADRLARLIGSWPFVLAEVAFVLLWVVVDCLGVWYHWDPYPFILLNLILGGQSALTGPVIMMSQNRQAIREGRRDDHEAEEVEELYAINQTQLALLQAIHTLTKLLDTGAPGAVVSGRDTPI